MKINGGGQLDGAEDVRRTGKHGASDKPARHEEPASTTPGEDTVQMSALTAALDTHAQKIERLREAVLSGTYSVSAREVASKIVADRLDDSSEPSDQNL